jgi:hypothetical protein
MHRVVLICFAASSLVADGIRPRTDSADYPARATSKGITIAAAAVAPDRVKKLFATDLNSAGYVVLEVAIYPDSGRDIDVIWSDFLLRIDSDSSGVRPAAPRAIAAQIDRKSSPHPRTGRGVDVYESTTIGYESGRDPVTGRPVRGVYTASGVGVGSGTPGASSGPTGPDPRMVRDELEKLALPQGRTTQPVAGYLYFPKSSGKVKKTVFELTYYGEDGKIRVFIPHATN